MNGNSYPYPMRAYASSRPGMMDSMQGGGMGFDDMNQGQSLDQASAALALGQRCCTDGAQIVSQNDKAENMRRRSMPVYANNTRAPQMDMSSPESRRLSMLNFGDPGGNDDFQFDMQAAGMEDLMRNNPSFSRAGDMQHGRNNNDLGINTQYQGQNSPYPNMAAPGSAYASPLHANGQLDMDMSPYPNNMSMAMDMDDSLNMMSSDMSMFPNSQFNTPMMDSPAAQEFIGPMPAPSQESNASAMPGDFKRPSLSNTPEARSGLSGRQASRTSSQDQNSMRSQSRPQSEQHSSSKSSNFATQMTLSSLKKQQPIALDPSQDLPDEKMIQANNFKNSWKPPPGGFKARPRNRHRFRRPVVCLCRV
jgi:hypothetical protein